MSNAEYRQRLEYFLHNRYYMASVLFTAVICYGYSVVNTTISIDGLEGSRYIGEGQIMLAAGRFGMKLLAAALGYGYSTPVYQSCANFLAASFLVLAALQFCMLFRRIWKDKISMFGYGVFSCLLISYPLINEIWEYTGANVCVTVGYFLSAVAVSLLYDVIQEPDFSNNGKFIRVFLTVLALLVIASSYESLIIVYVFTVFTVLSMQQLSGEILSVGKTIRRGLCYAMPLAVAVVLRLIIHRFLLTALDLTPQTGGATTIRWSLLPFDVVLKDLIKNCILYYGARACLYFPILELVVSVGVFALMFGIAVFRVRRPALALTGAGMLLSMFLLSILQGYYSPYRTCQVFSVLVALMGMTVYEWIRCRKQGEILTVLCGAALVLLCLHQATYLNHLLVLDHQRSQEEANVIRTIGMDLERGFPDDKPIILTGNYTISQGIQDQVTAKTEEHPLYAWFQAKTGWETDSTIKYVDTNVNSVINWAATAFSEIGSLGSSAQKLFRYYGFDLLFEVSPELRQEALAYAEEANVPAFPQDGYIVETPEYILVNLSTIKE